MTDHSITDPSNGDHDGVHPSSYVLAQLERLVQRLSSIESRLQVLEHAKVTSIVTSVIIYTICFY
jgi:hypothetical protein